MVNPASQSYSPGWWRNFALFSLCVTVPCLSIFRQAHMSLALVYAAGTTIGLFVWLRYVLPRAARLFTPAVCITATLAVFIGLAVATMWLQPRIVKAQGFDLLGFHCGVSDSNDAFVAPWKAMFSGRYPYYEKSFLGNSLSPMPGALFLALPFYLLGATLLQNVFWLLLFWLAVAWHVRDVRVASALTLTAITASPALIVSVIQGTDYHTNGLYILLPSLAMVWGLATRKPPVATLAAAAFLGIALSSRANFLLVVPVVFLAALRLSNLRTALKHLVLCGSVSALITFPFYFYDPAGFSPLHTMGKLDLGGRFPHAAEVVFAAGCVLATALGWNQQSTTSLEATAARCFVVQAYAVLSGFALASLAVGRVEMSYLYFGYMAMFFGVFAFGLPLFRQPFLPRETGFAPQRG